MYSPPRLSKQPMKSLKVAKKIFLCYQFPTFLLTLFKPFTSIHWSCWLWFSDYHFFVTVGETKQPTENIKGSYVRHGCWTIKNCIHSYIHPVWILYIIKYCNFSGCQITTDVLVTLEFFEPTCNSSYALCFPEAWSWWWIFSRKGTLNFLTVFMLLMQLLVIFLLILQPIHLTVFVRYRWKTFNTSDDLFQSYSTISHPRWHPPQNNKIARKNSSLLYCQRALEKQNNSGN